MKCLLVVNQLNDTFFIDYDLEFAEYIICRAKAKGLLEQESEVVELDANLVMQLFSPLVLSQWLLIDQTMEPCSSIKCPNGFQFVFKHVDDLLFLTINGDGTESEYSLHRKISVCIMIMRFLFGPVNEEIGQSNFYTKKAKWDFLRKVMTSWSGMISSEQAFFVEAIERLHVNQVVNEKCVEILQKAVKQVQLAKEIPTQHAILLVNSKLLALYSDRSAHELRPRDILAMMILSRTVHPCSDKLEDLFSTHYMPTGSRSSLDEISDGGEEEYHSAPNTPGGLRSRSSSTGSCTKQYEDTTNKIFHSEDIEVSPHRIPRESKFQYSESETVLQEMVSDQDSSTQDFSPGKGPSLIELYNEKYPESRYNEKSKEIDSEEKMSIEPESVQKSNGAGKTKKTVTVNVEAVVHNENYNTFESDAKSHHERLSCSTLGLQNPENTSRNMPQTGNSLLENKDCDEGNPSLNVDEADSSSALLQRKQKYEGSDTMEQNTLDQNCDHEIVTCVENRGDKESYTVNAEETVREQTEMPSAVQMLSETDPSVHTSPEQGVLKSETPQSTQSEASHGNSCPHSPENNLATNPSTANEASVTLEKECANQSEVKKTISNSHCSVKDPKSNVSLSESRGTSTIEPQVIGHDISHQHDDSGSQHNLVTDQPHSLSTDPSRVDSSVSTVSVEPSDTSSVGRQDHRKQKVDALYKKREGLSPTSVMKSTVESSTLTSQTSSSFLGLSEQSGSHKYWPETVFLETPTCLYAPYNLHILQVLPGVALMLLSQAPRYSLADALYQAIHNIQDLIYGRRSKLPHFRSLYVYEVINSLLAKIHSSLKKHKGRLRTLSYDIHYQWEKEDLKRKLLDYLERDAGTRIPPTLESPLVELYKKLKGLFSHLFLSHVAHKPEMWDTLSNVEKFVRKELTDYREYLSVKAQRNITMTSYINEFPGLVHFIFINRYFHEMMAPSLNISLKAGEDVDATSHLKEKIWKMYKQMMCRLTDGYTTVMLREGDFYFSFFLWFEDYTGKPLPVQESFKPSRKFHYPGILGGNFYSDLLHHCFPHATKGSVYCYEMFLVHLGTVHPHYIANHCKKLAKKMWEMSGEPYNYVSLL